VRYFQELGFDVVVLSPTDRKISMAGEELAIAQPCFPVKVAHGHVQDLLEKCVDYVLLPNIVNAEAAGRQLLWNRTCARGTRRCPLWFAWRPNWNRRSKFLVPTCIFRWGGKHVEKELADSPAAWG
jgi:hypothetical protein